MKKTLTLILALSMACAALSGCAGNPTAPTGDSPVSGSAVPSAAQSETPAQDTPAYTETTTELGLGTMQVYDFGAVKLHAYKTNDAIDDECFLIESANEREALEAPGFQDTIVEFRAYIDALGKPLNNVLLAYHPAGAETLSDSANYIATAGAQAAQQEGGSVKGLIDGFVESFGDSYDGTIPAVTELVEPGTLTIDGVDYVIAEGLDGFDVAIPTINCVFTHMVGADVHNIMPSIEAIDALAAQMQSYIDADYTLLLSSHYVPEPIEAAHTKLAYAQKMKELAESSDNAEDFIATANAEFPHYAGGNYLEMTAGGLYQ